MLKYCNSITYINGSAMKPKTSEKRGMVHVYLTKEEKKRIEKEAGKLGISVSAYIKVKLFSEK